MGAVIIFYVHIGMFVYFTLYTPWVCFVLVILFCVSPVHDIFCHCTIVISLFILIFLFIWYMCLCWYGYVFYTIYSLIVLSPDDFFYIYPVHRLLYHCIIVISLFLLICLCILHLCLQKYVCVLNMIYSLIVLHLGNFFIYISCVSFTPPLCRHPRWPEFTLVD